MTVRWLTVAVLTSLLVGCAAIGPDYAPPIARASATAAFIEADPAIPADPTRLEGAQLFQDPQLTALVRAALGANTDLRIAAARLSAARALSRQASAARGPQTTVRGGIDVDESTPDPTGATDTFDAALDVAYQLDLFGGLRRTAQAARADAEAEQAAAEALRLTVAAETARAYVEACGAAQRLAVAEASTGLLVRTGELVARQRSEGAASGLELAQSQTQLERSRAEGPAIAAERAAALSRLAVLTGRTRAELPAEVSGCATQPAVGAVIPVGDGAALLARRPDVRAAERRLAAATARIGVARAELYPQVRLGLSAGAGGERGSDIGFKWSASPLISWTFPNRVIAKARIARAGAEAEAALAAWDKATLTALAETETALSAYARELDRNAALVRAADAASSGVDRATLRYREGAESFLVVLDAQRQAAEIDAMRATSDTQLSLRRISLFLALGGPWS